MVSKKTKSTSRSYNEESPSDDTSLGTSQDVEMRKDVQDITKKCTERIKERRRQRKDQILTSHDDRLDRIRGDIKACFKRHDEQVRALRRPKIQQLIELHRKKREIEDRIDKSHSDLEKAFLDTAMQLQAAIDGRVDEMSR